MQLSRQGPARIGAALCLLTVNLLGATAAMAQTGEDSGATGQRAPEITNVYDQPLDELDTTSIDSAILYYKENGGRVQAIEPMVSVAHTNQNGNSWSAKLTFDSLTGATPNGATPWTGTQTFVSPIKAEHSSTGSSGTVVTNPATGKTERIYTTDPGKLPLDKAFRDTRVALDLGYDFSVASGTRLNLGLNGSVEKDFYAVSGRASISRELNGGATTLSLGANFEYDKIDPFHGVPLALTPMSGVATGRSDNRTVVTAMAGVTQILRPNWLVQLNYSFTSGNGYQTDPYKIVSVVDGVTGAPLQYLYESRPDNRTRHAVYGATKLALGSFVTDLSARYYHDSWGIDSVTVEGAEHVPIGRKAYVEPRVRYYRQTKADFFTYFLTAGQPLPTHASADSRLDGFSAWTYGATAGYEFQPGLEIYVNGEVYRSSKTGGYGLRPGALSSFDLYAGADSFNLMLGVKFKL